MRCMHPATAVLAIGLLLGARAAEPEPIRLWPAGAPGETPPTILIQTADDGVKVENSMYYCLALKKAGVAAEMHIYPEGGHGYGLRPGEHTVSSWPERCADWMRALGLLRKESKAR